MSTVLRYFFTKPFLLISNHVLRKFATTLTIFVVVFTGVVFYSYYNPNFSVSFWNSNSTLTKGNSIGEDLNNDEVTTDIITISRGDTLGAILRKQPLTSNEVASLIKLANQEKISSSLKIGQKITFEYDISLVESTESDLNTEKRSFRRMSIPLDNIRTLEFIVEDGKLSAKHINTPLNKLVTKYEATIENSVIGSLKDAGLTTNTIVKLINVYSHQIDFQRQIRPGDKITVITEKFVTQDSELSHHGQIMYANLKSGGKDHKIYFYSPEGNQSRAQYFGDNGQSIKSTLLRTPVNVVRISGHYGYRKNHPVLGYGAMHKGVDFAAPIGTPIYAAGDGIVEFIGWKGGYGRYILIKHNSNLKTAYAHSSRFAQGLKAGTKVKQGQIISYVGASGRVTGAHLHFEVHVNGSQVNPMKFKSQPGVKLEGKKLDGFKEFQKQIHLLSKKLDGGIDLAVSDFDLVGFN